MTTPRGLVERLEKVVEDTVRRTGFYTGAGEALAAEALAWVEEQMPPVRLNPDRKTPPSNVFRAGYVAALDDVRAALEFKEDHPDDPS